MSWWKRRNVSSEALQARQEAEEGAEQAQALLKDIRTTVPWLREIRQNNHFAESVRLSLGGFKE